jgi:hypothetical protein
VRLPVGGGEVHLVHLSFCAEERCARCTSAYLIPPGLQMGWTRQQGQSTLGGGQRQWTSSIAASIVLAKVSSILKNGHGNMVLFFRMHSFSF